MDHIRIAFFDIDGTLIDMHRGKPTARMLETLRRLQQNGIRICLATGRSPAALPRFEGVTFDACITYNGSLAYTGDEVIFSSPIAAGDVQQLIHNAAAIGRPIAVCTKDRLAANGYDQDLADYYAIAHLELTIAEDFDAVARQEVYQLLVGCRESDHPAILKEVAGVKTAGWWDRAVDLIPADGSKGKAILKTLEYFGIDREASLAFGDGGNDVEMLQTAGTGVAMGNAANKLKTLADDVCGHVADDGIYHYCLEHGLI